MGAWVKRRNISPDPATGKPRTRFYVYYSFGGAHQRQRYGGAFKTKADAETRRAVISGKLAAGQTLEIVEWLEGLKAPVAVVQRRGLEDAYARFMASRTDVSKATQALYRNSRDKILPILGHTTEPTAIRVEDVQQLVNELYKGDPPLMVKSIRQYIGTLGQVLAFADVEPNPVRSRKVRFPREVVEEVQPPSTAEWVAVRDHLNGVYRLFARLLECCGLRIGEGYQLTWGDIDWVGGRLRISAARTKTRSGRRWLPVPGSLLDEIAGLRPEEDRVLSDRVFVGFSETSFRIRLSGAVKSAGVAAFSPHDLRHRRISLWFAHGIDEIRVAVWAGHAQASLSQDVYGHVLIDASLDEWRRFWLEQYRGAVEKEDERV